MPEKAQIELRQARIDGYWQGIQLQTRGCRWLRGCVLRKCERPLGRSLV
jgi:hypothetical protein